MRRLTSVESRYWIDSFPIDLVIGCVTGGVIAGLTAWIADAEALRYYTDHRVLDPGQHHSAAAFLAVILGLFAFFATLTIVLVSRLILRLYRNPL